MDKLPRILSYSDLHMEHPANREAVSRLLPKSLDGVDLVLLGGDIDVGAAGVVWAAERFPGVPVAYILGNHEPYGQGSWEDTVQACKATAVGTNVRVLERDTWDVAGIRVLGCTLWTDYEAHGFAASVSARRAGDFSLNDSKSILNERGKPFRAEDAAREHRKSRSWLARELGAAAKAGIPAVVLTHHAPLLHCTRPEWRSDLLTAAFVNNMESWLTTASSPRLWCSGHTHYQFSGWVGRTYVHSNQMGYIHKKEDAAFVPDGELPEAAYSPPWLSAEGEASYLDNGDLSREAFYQSLFAADGGENEPAPRVS